MVMPSFNIIQFLYLFFVGQLKQGIDVCKDSKSGRVYDDIGVELEDVSSSLRLSKHAISVFTLHDWLVRWLVGFLLSWLIDWLIDSFIHSIIQSFYVRVSTIAAITTEVYSVDLSWWSPFQVLIEIETTLIYRELVTELALVTTANCDIIGVSLVMNIVMHIVIRERMYCVFSILVG